MIIRLQWPQKNWQLNGKGYGENFHLNIDADKKTYSIYTNTYIGGAGYIDVVRKSDLTDLVKTLNAEGYIQVKGVE